jgi:polar amino acid transport system permease protein
LGVAQLNYDWNFGRLIPYLSAFLSGTLTTLTLTIIVIIFGTIIGIFIGIIITKRLPRLFLYPVIDIIRALPPLVLILFMYFLLTRQVIGTSIQAYWVCVIAMSLNLSAFTADLVRSAIENVPRPVLDAGKALGMSPPQLTMHIVLPYVLREIIPALTLLYIAILKMSSLASIINVSEVVYTAQTVISNISRSLEAWAIVALIYCIIVIPATYLARKIEIWAGRGIGK